MSGLLRVTRQVEYFHKERSRAEDVRLGVRQPINRDQVQFIPKRF